MIKRLNLDFEVVSPDFDEKLEDDNYSDKKIESLSLKKSQSVLRHTSNPSRTDFNSFENSLIISADTVVVLDNKILGKPKDEADAKKMLKSLSGKKHFVVTAITVLDSDTQKFYNAVEKTFVTFCDLSDELINYYVQTKKPLDKAGSYGIQEMGSEFIKSVEGDLENVIGLPTKVLKTLLIQAGYEF